ncbi:MAG: L,D-transpeptidase [Atopobiaceae bacterium]
MARTQEEQQTPRHGARHEEPRRTPQQPRSRRKASKAPLIIAVIAVVYLAGCIFFMNHVLPGTTAAGQDISLANASTLSSRLADAADGFSVTASDTDGTESFTISGADAGFSYDADKAARELLHAQSSLVWPVAAIRSLWGRSEVVLPSDAATLDESSFSDAVSSAVEEVNAAATPSEDAHLAYDADQQSFVVAAETRGNQLHEDVVEDAVRTSFQHLASSCTLNAAAYITPEVLSTDERLASAIPAANALMGAQLTITLDGTTVATPSDNIVADWIELDDSYQPQLTVASIEKWAEDNFDTVGTTRTFTDYEGRTRTVVCNTNPESESTYGQLVDAESFAEEAYAAATAKDTATIDIAVTQEADGFTKAGEADWGDRYIDVDITNQHAVLVDAGQVLWESDVVTGNVSAGNDTPEGVFTIQNMMNSITLTGEDASENFVYNWMGFIRTVWGLHDATWRTEFGGDIYKTDGSHGCVNLPLDAANELYGLVHVGDVVVVHE